MTMTLHYSSSYLQWLLQAISGRHAWQQSRVIFPKKLMSGLQDGVTLNLMVSAKPQPMHCMLNYFLFSCLNLVCQSMLVKVHHGSSQWVCHPPRPCRRWRCRLSVTMTVPGLMDMRSSQSIWCVLASLRGARTHARQETNTIILYMVTVQVMW